MKKTVSIVLSIAMVLSLMTGLFTLNLSADEVPYAETQAQTLWAEATKATEVKIFVSDKADGESVTIPNNTSDANLATLFAAMFTSGTVSFKDGVLILKDVAVAEGKTPFFRANGGLNIDFTGADLKASFNLGGVYPAVEKQHIIITSSDGHDLVWNNGNALRSNSGAVVTYGPMGLNVNAVSGYDCVIVGYTKGDTVPYPLILGNTGGTVLSAGGTGPAVESRSGDIIVCGNGDFTFKNTNAAYTGSAMAVHGEHSKEAGNLGKDAAVKISEGANVSFETVGGEAIRHNGLVEVGKDAINIDTTGTVKFTATALNVNTWKQGNVVTVDYGAVKIASKVLVKMNVGSYKGGAGCGFYLQNSGNDTSSGLYISENGELAISLTTNIENVRSTGVWVNSGVVDVSDNAKFTVRYEHNNTVQANFGAVVVKIGRFNISDNARVYFHGINNGTTNVSGNKAIDIQFGQENDTAADYEAAVAARAFFGDNAGLHVTGGQLEINAPSDAVNYANKAALRGGSHFSGGVVSVQDVGGKGAYLFPQDLDQVNDTRFNEVKNAEYCGPVTLDDGTKITKDHAYYNDMSKRAGNVAEYLYVAKDAAFTEYDGIAENADFFGTLSTAHNDVQSYFVANPRYRVSLSSLVTAPTHGDKVDVYVNVTHEASTEYAASELTVNYDAAKLAFDQVSSQLNGAEVTDADGVLKIVNYGQDKLLGNGIYTLSFTTLVSGESSVTLASAAFADKVSAEESDLLVGVIDPDTATVTFSVQKKVFQVTLPAGFEGPETVTDGESYTFKLVDNNYNYSNFSATAGETPLVVTDNGDGTYTVNNVTGNLTVTVDSVPKSYPVTFTPSDAIASGDATATYGTNYVFYLKDNILPGETDGTNYSVESITVGGVAFNDYTVEDRKITVPGASITGDIAVTVKVERVDANKFAVTVDGSGAGDVKTDGVTFVAEKGQPYSITLIPQLGYDYTVTATVAGNSAQVSVEGNVYTVQNVGGPVVFTVTRTVNTDNVTYSEFITLDSAESDMYLVLNKTTVGEGKVPTLNGVAMFWSEKYDAYCGLVIIPAPASENDVKSLISIADGNAVTVDYGMDVNKTGKVDAADAQLVYNMYNAYYTEFTSTVTQEKFLRADVNGDKVIDVTDATAIVTEILK